MVYFTDQMHAGMIHDRIEKYQVSFYYVRKSNYADVARTKVVLWIEEGDKQDRVLKTLRQRYKVPEIISMEII